MDDRAEGNNRRYKGVSMQDISTDMRDLLALFKKHRVQFALCGGFAVAFYGFIRATMDMDLLVYPSAENADRLMQALEEFGFGNTGLSCDVFKKPGTVVTLGAQPNQIDLLTSMSSETAETIFEDIQTVQLWDMAIPVVSRRSLMQAKAESKRAKDRIDLEELQRIAPGDF